MKTYFNLKKGIYVVIACVIAAISFSFTQNITPDEPDCHIIIDASQPQLQLSPDMYGIFFEDINHASDGGLYGELIQNRDFEAGRIPENMKFIANDTIQNSVGWKEHYVRPTSLYSWNMIKEGEWEGSAEQTDAVPLNPGNPNYMKFEVTKTGKGRIAVSNNGYWGISLKKGEKYSLSLYAFKDAASKGEVKVSLESKTGKVYTSIVISGISASWKRFSALLTSNADDTSACFVLSPLSKGVINFDVISLFPQKTFNNRKYGLRNDLAQMLKDMKPSFIRFPGGCVVEGASVENRIQWKKTIGGISERPGHWNLWGYHTYDGIGFHDYLQLCEDLNAEPLYVVNVGMACQYRGGEFDKGEVRKYINETLDALEYAMGPVTSKWGAIRAKNGHPKPFHIKYIEIGNENWGEEYSNRYYEFYKTIKEKYPLIITIADGEINIKNMPEVKSNIEMIDEHYYLGPYEFYKRASMYDKYNRDRKRRIYIGEFAVTSGKIGKGNLRGALAESAYMIGMERNADMVKMASYAPTFVNANNRNWNPDMIVFNSSKVYGTPSYQAIKMFSNNRPDKVLTTTVNVKQEEVKEDIYKGGIALGTWGTVSEYKDIKVTSGGKELFSEDFSKGIANWLPVSDQWQAAEGALRNSGNTWETLITSGNNSWKDYTLTLKARKIKGDEGFAVGFYVKNGEENYRWNIGGWGNTETCVQSFGNSTEDVGKRVKGHIDTGKWYDIKIETNGNHVKCYLDGELIHDLTLPQKFAPSCYAASGISKNKDEVIIKVVNPSDKVKSTQITLKGIENILPDGEVVILSSDSQDDENSFINPEKVAPKTIKINNAGKDFIFNCPANSLCIIKLRTVKK